MRILLAVTLLVMAGCGSDSSSDTTPTTRSTGATTTTGAPSSTAAVVNTSDIATSDDPRTMVFSDDDACSQLTGSAQCGFVMCDLIPEGQTFDESCGAYFQEGLTDPGLDDEEIDRILEVMVPECAIAREVENGFLRVDLPAGGWLSIGGPAAWLNSVSEATGTDCEA